MHTVTEACPLSLILLLYSGLEKWQNKKAEKTCQKLCEIINHLFRSCVYTDVRTERAEMSIRPVEPSVSRIPSVLARRNAGVWSDFSLAKVVEDCPMKSEANRKPAESRSIVNER